MSYACLCIVYYICLRFGLTEYHVLCILQLDVTGLNYVSRMSHSFVLMTVEHAAFSSDGQWLATVSVPWSAVLASVETHVIIHV